MAVKDKKVKAWDQLLKLEEEVNHARQKASEAGKVVKRHADEVHALVTERRRLAYNDKRLVDHRGQPSDVPDNPIRAIDEKLAEYDLEDDQLRYRHAKELEAQAQAEVNRHIVPVFWELIEAVTPEAHAAAEEVRLKMAEAHDAVEQWVNVYRRVLGLTTPMGNVDGRDIPGLEHAAALAKAVRGVELPVPLPVRRDQ